ncbi:MAG: hypothetical protein ACJ0RU_04470 [Candidatus Rariloculaceae bacterium]
MKKNINFLSVYVTTILILSSVNLANSQEEPLRSESGEWVCVSRDSDGISPYAFAIQQDTFELNIYDDAVFNTMRECESALSEPIETADNQQYFCASRDADGVSPWDVFRWDVDSSLLGGSTYIDFQQLGLITNSIRECENSIENVSIRSGRAFICASVDNDGIYPFSMFELNENPDPVGQEYSSLNDCFGSVASAVNAGTTNANETAAQVMQEESGDPVTATSESGEWVCTSRDSDGLSPYAFAIQEDTFEIDIYDDAVFDSMRECESALSEPIEAVDGEQYFCASRDADGLSPYDVFRWNVESSFFGGDTFIDFDQLGLITDSIRECENSIENVSIRNDRAFACASRDADGLSPYSVFELIENPGPVGQVHDRLNDCVNSLQ